MLVIIMFRRDCLDILTRLAANVLSVWTSGVSAIDWLKSIFATWTTHIVTVLKGFLSSK